ncbi:MAG: TadE/TadG family type IV pilus assembly protein [Candidatus Dormibacteria bacterium]
MKRLHHFRIHPRKHAVGQTMVEFAVLLPVMLTVFLGAIAIDSYIQAQSLLQQATTESALTIARNANDSCSNGDVGYAQAINAFDAALKSSLFSTLPSPTITCVSAISPQSKCVVTAGSNICTNIPAVCSDGYGGTGSDGGCFGIWRGGVVGVDVTANVTLPWIPIWNHATVQATSAEALEPFRSHVCPTSAVPIDYC